MKVHPVLDLKAGQVVRAVRGDRDEYRPWKNFRGDADPVSVIAGLRERFPLDECYIADLDALTTGERQDGVLAELLQIESDAIVDAGANTLSGIEAVLRLGAGTVMLPLELSPSLKSIGQAVREFGADRLCFSLDLRAGQPLGTLGANPPIEEPIDLVRALVDGGIMRILVLDLSDVGSKAGHGSRDLCRKIIAGFGLTLDVLSGGGLRNANDLQRAKRDGLSGVAIASMLHTDAVTATELQAVRSP